MSRADLDLTGKVFGRLTVLGLADKQKASKTWRCVCECGKETSVVYYSLLNGSSRSCGCQIRAETIRRSTKHGMCGTKIYIGWKNMMARCYQPNSSFYYRYGARGIKVCERWKAFENFYADVGDIPFEGASIDRINVDGDYEPSNFRWATAIEQANNKSTNRYVTYKGVKRTVADWARALNMNQGTLYYRLFVYGWSVERSFNTGVRNASI